MTTKMKQLGVVLLISLITVSSADWQAAAYQPFMTPSQGYYTWNIKTGPVRWSVAAGAPEIVRESMLAVTHAWSDATAGAIAFEEAPGGITVEWDAAGTKIVDTFYLAYTTFNADAASHIYSSNVTINALNYTWHRGGATGVGPAANGKRDANLDTVLMHELGHALGLDHSDKKPDSIVGGWSATDLPTMNSVIYPGMETLHGDDDAGIKALYAGTASAVQAPPGLAIVASPLSGSAPLNVSFETSDGDMALWDFGTGKKLTTAQALSHKFAAPGTYTVTATSGGKTATITIEVQKRAKRAPKPKRKPKQ